MRTTDRADGSPGAIPHPAPANARGFAPPGGHRPLWPFALLVLLLLTSCASAERFSGLDAEALYHAGVAAFEARDWDDAVAALERHLSTGLGHPLNPDARMLLARAHVQRREYITAAAEFELFLQFYPNHGLAPDASLGICMAYAELSPIPQRDQEYTEQAVQACTDTVRQFQGLNVATEAEAIRIRMVEKLAQSLFEQAEFYRWRGGLNSAVLYFEEVVRRYPETRWAPRAILAMHRAYRDLGWNEEAEEEADRLLERYPDSGAAAELRRERGADPFLGN